MLVGCDVIGSLTPDEDWPRAPLEPGVGPADRLRWDSEAVACSDGKDARETLNDVPTHVLVLCDGKTCAEGYRSFEPGGAFLGAYCVTVEEFESWRDASCPDCWLDCGKAGDDRLLSEPDGSMQHLAPCRIRLPSDEP